MYDAIKEDGDAGNPMAVAMSQFMKLYRREGSGDDKHYVSKQRDDTLTGKALEINGHSHTVAAFFHYYKPHTDSPYTYSDFRGITSIDSGHFHTLYFASETDIAQDANGRHSHRVEWEDTDAMPLLDALGKEAMVSSMKRIQKSRIFKADDEKHIVIGPVLVPDEVDFDNEVISAEEIEKTFYKQAIRRAKQASAETGLMHDGDAIEEVYVVEDYLTPCDIAVGDVEIPKGTWMRGVKVESDKIWKRIKAGELTAFSIQGYSDGEEVETDAS